jgi:5'-nucleotidase / UDP-sugar diphosphatase
MVNRRQVAAWAGTFLAVIACGMVWAATDPAPASRPVANTVRLTLLHVNDSHGRLEPHNFNGASRGGYARLKTAVDEIRASGGADAVLLIHAGDVFSKGDDLTQRTLGAANVALMNYLKFDIWTPGNGEFYDGLPNLRARIKQANFDVITSNVALPDRSATVGKPSVVRTVAGVRVGFMGMCTVRKRHESNKKLVVGSPVETAKKLVPQLRKQADVVVAVNHIGFFGDVRLAGSVGGIDVIIGGHSHTVLQKGRRAKGPDGRPTLIAQAGEFLRYLGRVDLKLERKGEGWRIAESKATLIPLDAKIKLDPTVTALIAKLARAKKSLVGAGQ